MKRKFLQSAVCLLLLGVAWSCSSDSETIMSDTDSRNIKEKDKSVWNEAIAEDVDGELVLVADRDELIAAFESILLRQSNGSDAVKVDTVIVKRKIAVNNPNDTAVFVIGGGTSSLGSKVSAGVILIGGGGNLGRSFFSGSPDPTSVSCWGCGTGCFLEYYDIDGHKVPYCNSAGCGPVCDRIFD